MSIKVWIDGEYYPKDEAKVSVFDHGLLYGDGVFEGIRAYHVVRVDAGRRAAADEAQRR